MTLHTRIPVGCLALTEEAGQSGFVGSEVGVLHK